MNKFEDAGLTLGQHYWLKHSYIDGYEVNYGLAEYLEELDEKELKDVFGINFPHVNDISSCQDRVCKILERLTLKEFNGWLVIASKYSNRFTYTKAVYAETMEEAYDKLLKWAAEIEA